MAAYFTSDAKIRGFGFSFPFSAQTLKIQKFKGVFFFLTIYYYLNTHSNILQLTVCQLGLHPQVHCFQSLSQVACTIVPILSL